MKPLLFEWDEAKNTVNRRKHGVSFDEAKTVFAYELARLLPDPDHSVSEERFILLGMSRSFSLLVVCHCEHGSEHIRIISARKANRHERKQYEGFTHA